MIAKSAPLRDVEYFRVRALQEQVAAANATSVKARNCHDELAMMYRFRATMLSTPADRWSDTLLKGDTDNKVEANAASRVEQHAACR